MPTSTLTSTSKKDHFMWCYAASTTQSILLFFFFLRGGNPHGHQAASGGKQCDSAELQPSKTSTMTVPAAIERGPRTGASFTPGHSRAQNAWGAAVRGSLVRLPDYLALVYQRLSLTPIGGAAALARLVQARPRRLPRSRRSILSGWELRTLALSATSFRSITCSQKEVTAPLPLSLSNIASRIAGGERSHSISTMRSRRGRGHAGQNTNVCYTKFTLASQWWQHAVASFLIRSRYSTKHPCPVSTCVTL